MWEKKRIIVISLIVLIVISVSLTLIPKNTNKSTRDNIVNHEMASNTKSVENSTEDDEIALDNGATENKVDNKSSSQKIITNLFISMETKEFDNSINHLNNIVNKYKGYIENSDISYNNHVNNNIYKYAQYTIRMPKNSVDKFTNEINKIGNIISQSTSKEDITKEYYDTESKLNVLKIKEERILKILESAEKIEDILKLEDELNKVIYEKESITNEMKDMDNKISYSTLIINITEVDKFSNIETTKTSFGEKIINTFNNSLYFLKLTMENIIIIVIYILPFALIIGLVYLIINKFIRKK
ncbi:DUF4349 domain-containing protein [Anaerosalibacter massiliensis]|uniref:DUF4349 domain-containing protein n=1 Tax=Anaerosalibacter massiliensis TaxID=1347392 RepID=A0A9X2S5Q1_9FIRM|nr:DUF4349 domain-containing protein [Anaerosalibacter massiliensis]MCR2044564.1 DUF4349 domain-containing protein [Anaerosalibacter massiliensis]